MDETIQSSFRDFRRIIGQLDAVLAIDPEELNDRDRDSGILRFELAFEVCWKLLQRLIRNEGIETSGPRSAFERAFELGWLADEVVWYDILKDRNTAIHVYREEWAEALFKRLFRYLDAFRALEYELAGRIS